MLVVGTEDGVVVKRAGADRVGNWQLASDNLTKRAWPTMAWPDAGPMPGEVKWAARTFV